MIAQKPVVAGEVGHALVHHLGRAVGQRAVDDVAVAGDPTDIGGAPVDVIVVQIEHVLVGEGHLRQVAATGVHDALGLAGGARGVQQEQQLLAVHRLGRADRVGLAISSWYQWSRPSVIDTSLPPRRTTMTSVIDGRVGQRFVGDRLQRQDLATPVATVGRDQHFRFGVVDAVAQRVRAEPAEHHAVRRTDARAGQHRHGCFGDHRQVDVDAVALADAEALQHVCQPLRLVEQLGVGDDA